VSLPFLIAGLQIGFLSTILIAINNLRDSETDQLVHKKTLAVCFGDNFVRLEIFFLTFVVYLLNLYYLVALNKLYPLISFAIIPLGGLVVGCVMIIKDKKQLNKILALAALHQLLFATMLSIGFLI